MLQIDKCMDANLSIANLTFPNHYMVWQPNEKKKIRYNKDKIKMKKPVIKMDLLDSTNKLGLPLPHL